MADGTRGTVGARARQAGLVLAGYVAAVLFAAMVTTIYVQATDTPERVSASGMYAFGDSLLFLGVFAIASVPPTAGAFYFLRSSGTFWKVLTAVLVVTAGTALLAVSFIAMDRFVADTSPVRTWAALSVLRILIAPAIALVDLAAAVVCPERARRRLLFGTAAVETMVFGSTFVVWFLSST